MPIPIVWRVGAEQILPTYSFVELVSGTGYILFYAGITEDVNILVNNAFYSDPIRTDGTPNTDGWTLDMDFDVLVNKPLTLKGTAVINIPVKNASTAPTTCKVICEASIRKWDGSSETNLITNDARDFDSAANEAYRMDVIDLVVPQTHFKRGEYIRLTIRLYTQSAAGAYGGSIAHDPMARTGGWDSTGVVPSTLIAQIPVRIDL